MSVVLVTFSGAPKVSEEAQRKDAELNSAIEKEVNRKWCWGESLLVMTSSY